MLCVSFLFAGEMSLENLLPPDVKLGDGLVCPLDMVSYFCIRTGEKGKTFHYACQFLNLHFGANFFVFKCI